MKRAGMEHEQDFGRREVDLSPTLSFSPSLRPKKDKTREKKKKEDSDDKEEEEEDEDDEGDGREKPTFKKRPFTSGDDRDDDFSGIPDLSQSESDKEDD